MLQNEYTLNKKTYTLTELPPSSLVLGKKPALQEDHIFLGYIKYEDIVGQAKDSINQSILDKYTLVPELLTPSVPMFAPTYWGRVADKQKVLVIVGKQYVLDRAFKSVTEPLALVGPDLDAFLKSLKDYTQKAGERKRKGEMASLAEMISATKGISVKEAMDFLLQSEEKK